MRGQLGLPAGGSLPSSEKGGRGWPVAGAAVSAGAAAHGLEMHLQTIRNGLA